MEQKQKKFVNNCFTRKNNTKTTTIIDVQLAVSAVKTKNESLLKKKLKKERAEKEIKGIQKIKGRREETKSRREEVTSP